MTDTAFDTSRPDAQSHPVAAPHDGVTMSLQKIGLICALALATLIPNVLISGLIEERETRQEAVRQEFARTWGPQQQLQGPIVVVPYQPPSGRPRQYLKIAATRLEVVANLDPQERRRGLFYATVYDARVEMEGTFLVPGEQQLRDFLTDKESRILWSESFIALGTATGLTGLRSEDHIAVNGVATPWLPCLEAVRHEADCRGASVIVASAGLEPAAKAVKVAFKSAISLRGTGSFGIAWAGKELDATVRSSWTTPSFGGNVLPTSSSLTPQGFEARWAIAELGSPRVVSAATVADPAPWKGSTIGVDLIEATPIYRMITRVAKYGLLLVVLSFATYFFFEILSRLRIHVVQYGLLAVSLSLFSLLLLSLSEPIGYTAGYVASAGLVLIQSSLYTAAVARRAKPALAFAGMLASLFAFLYVLLGLDTYALLVGALALFVVVSAVMVLTQRVSWLMPSSAGGSPGEEGPPSFPHDATAAEPIKSS
jgi:inner membrane protein